ncbi:efflux transporter periplasmic adaptor subunit [Alcanivorax sp. N3-2A]|nr:efflux transporter periplasmic adaptor subunit [Alcanivorax sp. N3-2A]|tara:strand:+ start:116377 stop:117417 length:1041 start_codon:yes stop_codon:yes gene_type:complete
MVLSRRSFRVIAVLVLLILAGAGFYTLNRPESSATWQNTNDAYVQADLTRVSPQIAGRVERVLVKENQPVHAGEPLLEIDHRDASIKVDEARAALAQAAAEVTGLQARLQRQQSTIDQAHARLSANRAAVTLAEQERSRYQDLAQRGAGTVQALQRAHAELAAKRASQAGDQAAYAAAKQELEVLRADIEQARAAHDTAQARLDAAELALSYTRIAAPVSGTVAQKVVRPGAYVNIGETLLTLVPLAHLYITAHFRETQIAHMRAGQPVRFTVDALPHVPFSGKVASLGPASSVSFSPIPPHNASGNFTKIVQRLPVRIAVDPDQPGLQRLKVGMSVVVDVDTRTD